jgi:hypothetical protein
MTTDVAGYRVRPLWWTASLPGSFVRATDRGRVDHRLRPPGLATVEERAQASAAEEAAWLAAQVTLTNATHED